MYTQLQFWAANEEKEKGLERVRVVWCGVDLFLLCSTQGDLQCKAAQKDAEKISCRDEE